MKRSAPSGTTTPYGPAEPLMGANHALIDESVVSAARMVFDASGSIGEVEKSI